MRPITRYVTVVALVGVFAMTWRAQTDQDVVAAQAPKPIMVTRIYTGADGLSHAEEIALKMIGNGGATEMMKATGAEFSRRPPVAGPANDWHVGPRRQFVITLSGRAEIEVAGGQKVAIGPGQINLIEDTTGKGHITKSSGDKPRHTIFVPID